MDCSTCSRASSARSCSSSKMRSWPLDLSYCSCAASASFCAAAASVALQIRVEISHSSATLLLLLLLLLSLGIPHAFNVYVLLLAMHASHLLNK